MIQYDRMEKKLVEISEYLREIVHLLRTRLELPDQKPAHVDWSSPRSVPYMVRRPDCEHGVALDSPCHKCGRT